MKKYLFLIFVIASITIWGQIPQLINYQAVARNPNGTPIVNGTVDLTFKIYQNIPTGQAPLFMESQPGISVSNYGLFTTQIGKTQPQFLSTINWSSGSKWLEVTIKAGNNPPLVSSQELVSVPYALYAESTKLQDIAIFENRRPLGSNESCIGGIGNDVNLNYVANPSSNVTLNTATSEITFLQPGKYLITAHAIAGKVNNHRLELFDPIGLKVVLLGMNAYDDATQGSSNSWSNAVLNGVLTVPYANFKVFLEHYCKESGSTGVPISRTGYPEIFGQIIIQRIQ